MKTYIWNLIYLGWLLLLAPIGANGENTDLQKLQSIVKLLLGREDMIQTAVLEYERTSALPGREHPQFEKGVEKYKSNKAYTYMCVYDSPDVENRKPAWVRTTCWNGASSFNCNLKSKMALIGSEREPGVVPGYSRFYKTSFIHPHHSFRIECTDPTLLLSVNDIWILRKDSNACSIPGIFYNDKSFSEGRCVLEKKGDNILRFTQYNPETKTAYQIVEFDIKSNYFPVRVVTYLCPAANADGSKISNAKKDGLPPYVEITMNDLREVVPGIYFAFNVKRTAYASEKNHQSVQSVEEIKIKKIELNGRIDDAEFTPQFSKGTQVIDKQKGTMYTVKEN